MSTTPDHPTTDESSEQREPVWWRDLLHLDAADDGAPPLPESDADALFPEVTVEEEPHNRADSDRAGPSRPRTYTLAKLNQIAASLRDLPELDPLRRRLDKLGAIHRLRESILAARRRGYTLDEIAETLSAAGIQIKGATLRVYLHRAKRSPRQRARDARKRAALPLVLRERIRG